MKTHYSVADLLELELDILPKSRKGLEKFLARQQWKYREVPSRGKGGTRKEYELSNEVKELLVLKNIQYDVATQSNCEFAVNQQNVNELMHWQVEIAENRLFVVRYLQTQVKNGWIKTRAIEQFIFDITEEKLSSDLFDAVLKANAKAGKGRTVSRRSLFDWFSLVESAEANQTNVLSMLAPKPRITNQIPVWAHELLKLWGQPQKPSLVACLELLPNYLSPNIDCPSYAQAYRFLNEKMGT